MVKAAATVLLALALQGVTSPAAPNPMSALTGPPAPARPAPAPAPPADPLGRGTPRGALVGFAWAAGQEYYSRASYYLRISPEKRKQSGYPQTLARQLDRVLVREFHLPLSSVNDSPEGALDDGLPVDRERLGTLGTGPEAVNLDLVRVADPRYGRIWVVAPETLEHVPDLYLAMRPPLYERIFPAWLVNERVFSISLAKWILWIGSAALPLLLLWLLSRALAGLIALVIRDPARRDALEDWRRAAAAPVVLILTILLHAALVPAVEMPLASRIVYLRCLAAVLVVVIAWLIKRLTELGLGRAYEALERQGRRSSRSLLLLSGRVFRVIIALAAILGILTLAGVDVRAALAGIGIGGVALAFGAQKSVENLFGAISLLSDRALAVGDVCHIGGRTGTVEDITLRSVRLRTLEETVLTIPAGVLAQDTLENLTSRQKILLKTTLGLQYGTSTAQLRQVLDALRRMAAEHPKIEGTAVRIRLSEMGSRAIQIELYLYILTSDVEEFCAIREDVLLRASEIVEAAGTGFVPTMQVTAAALTAPAAVRSSDKRTDGRSAA